MQYSWTHTKLWTHTQKLLYTNTDCYHLYAVICPKTCVVVNTKSTNHKTTTRNVAVYSSYMTTIDYSFTYSRFRTTAFSYSVGVATMDPTNGSYQRILPTTVPERRAVKAPGEANDEDPAA